MSDRILKILLVEDNPAEVELVCELLDEANQTRFELTEVKRLDEGLTRLRQDDFDVVLLDLSLPDSQGLETLIRVKTHAPHMPIVVLTVLNDENLAVESVRKGAQDYLVKGQFEGELLVRSLCYAIARQRDREEIRLQAERERLLASMLDNIRGSLNLHDILQTTVTQVRHFLNADRVLVYRFSPNDDECGGLEAAEGAMENIDVSVRFPERQWRNCRLSQAIADVDRLENLDPDYRDYLQAISVRALLSVPIIRRTQNGSTEVWGALMVHHGNTPRHWEQWEIDCLLQLAAQAAIAIQQSELYEQLERANQELQQLVNVDGLTRIANRRHFDRVLESEWRRTSRQNQPLSLILCDIDFFKPYNDTYGHPAGDRCLQTVAAAISSVPQRPSDLVARYGGEEFAVILSNTDREGAHFIAQEIRNCIARLEIYHPASPISSSLTLSMGISSTIPRAYQSPANLIQAADRALYEAKARGRDGIVALVERDRSWSSVSC